MVIELLNYQTSMLNPILKLLAPLLYVIALILFFKASKAYGGEFKKGLNFLMISLILGIAAFTFGFLGDIITLDFKWGESLFFLAFAIMNLFVAAKFLKYVEEVNEDVRF
ncbi:MAG: hypothetical protein MIO93_04070 [ANME-2 cluster archaeon]|jgi:hypothetical protein|nr:hypothetical protein [ANME-2 cluster archaeon]